MVKQSLVFKNNLPNITVLKLFSQDIDELKAKLQQKVNQAPMMFVGMYIIVDLTELEREAELTLDVPEVFRCLEKMSINPIAVMTDKVSFANQIRAEGIAVLPFLKGSITQMASINKSASNYSNKPQPQPTSVQNENAPVRATRVQSEIVSANHTVNNTPTVSTEEPRKTFDSPTTVTKPMGQESEVVKNQIINRSIRSGQRVYCQGDLTIIGSVSNGAEVIADGNIHIYGKLSGRAIAGAKGDENAAIFCKDLDAELVSIAGSYKQLEDIDKTFVNKSVQVSLIDEKINFFLT